MPRPHRSIFFIPVFIAYELLILYSTFHTFQAFQDISVAYNVLISIQNFLVFIIATLATIVIGCSSAVFLQNKERLDTLNYTK